MPRFEEIVYDIGRRALAEQQAHVVGLQQRAGALVAANALVSSFLGTTAVRAHGLTLGTWIAIGALAIGLVAASILLLPWKLAFTLDAKDVLRDLRRQAEVDAEEETLGWLIAIGLSYQAFRVRNTRRIERLSYMSIVLGASIIVQTLGWILVLV